MEENKTTVAQQATGIRAYFAELAKYPPLRMEQEAELARRIAAGAKKGATEEEKSEAKAAKDRLILSNARLVASIATEYIGRGLGYEDLVSEGNLGLIRAAESFSADAGYKFGTYAGWWVREKINKALQDDGRTVRVSASAAQQMGVIGKAIGDATQALGRAPTDEEIIARLDGAISETRARELLRFMGEGQGCVTSLNLPYGKDAEIELIDIVGSEHNLARNVEAEDRASAIRAALATLTPRERRLIELRYGLDGRGGKTYEMTALALADEGYVSPVDGAPLTRERIRQIESAVLERLQWNKSLRELK